MSTIFMKFFAWLLIIVSAHSLELPKGWIDPHDMGPSVEYIKYLDTPEEQESHRLKIDRKSWENNDFSKADAYYKRTINMILNAVNEDLISTDEYSGYLYIKLTYDKLSFLRNFALGKSNNYVDVDRILSDVLTKSTHQELAEYFESWIKKGFLLLLSRSGIICAISFAYMLTFIFLLTQNFKFKYIFYFVLINWFIIDFVFTWINLYQNAEIEKITKAKIYEKMPSHCDPSKQSRLEFMWTALSSDEQCKEYHQVKYKDIFYTITPFIVLGEMFSQTVKAPVTVICRSLAELYSTIFYATSLPVSFIMFPVILIFSLVFLCIICSFAFGRTFKFNFLHLFSINFGHQDRNIEMKPIKNIKQMFAELTLEEKRLFIENVRKMDSDSEESDAKVEKENIKTLKAIKSEENEIKDNALIDSFDEKIEENTVIKEKREIGAGDTK